MNHLNQQVLAKRVIALYFQKLGGEGGGAERMLCFLANELSSRGYVVHIFSWDATNASSFYEISDDVYWHRLNFFGGVRDKARRSIMLYRLLRRYRIKVLIGFVMSGDMTVYAAALASGTRVIAAERNAPSMYYYLYGTFRRCINFNLLRFVNKVIVQNEEFRNDYPKYLVKKIVSIPNPVKQPITKASPDSAFGRTNVVLYIGRLEPVQKRPEILLEAFALVAASHPDWNLVFVGDGISKVHLLARIRELCLESRVSIFRTTLDVESFYLSAQLYVMPSAWEGFPNALAEAMSYGLPVIGFEGSQGVASLISTEQGWLAKGVDSYNELAKSLASAFSAPDERVARGISACRITEAFAANEIIDAWENVINLQEKSHSTLVMSDSDRELSVCKNIPLITIGLTVFNAQETLAASMKSILSQTWSNIEVVVVDDHSTDKSYSILKDWADENPEDIRLFRLDKNSGVAAARNKILSESKGEFVAFFDDDDVSCSHRLVDQWTRIVKYERDFADNMPVICHSARDQLYPNGEQKIEVTMGDAANKVAPNGPLVAKRILLGTPAKNAYGSCATCSQMARISTYQLVGGFDSQLRRSEDTDLIIRLAIKGAHFPGISEPLVKQMMTATSEKTSLEEFDNMKKILIKHKTFINKYGNFDFVFMWLRLKLILKSDSKILFLYELFKLFFKHPINTLKRLFMATPRMIISGKENRFQRDLDSRY